MSPTVKELIEELKAMDGPFRKFLGRPQKCSFVGDKLYWLEGQTQELMVYSLSNKTSSPAMPNAAPPKSDVKPMSKEEELLRERLRQSTRGISWFAVRPTDEAVYFMSGISLFLYLPQLSQVFPLLVEGEVTFDATVQSPAAFFKTTVTCIAHVPSSSSASCSNQFTFVNNGNCYLATIDDSRTTAEHNKVECVVTQLTFSGVPQQEFGSADYIMEEEFSRYTGHWAQGSKLLFTHTDTTRLGTVTLARGSDEPVETMPFPKVGDNNAQCAVAWMDMVSKEIRLVPNATLRRIAPWCEYIPRLGFVKGTEVEGSTICLTLLSRDQERVQLVSFQVADLPVVNENEVPLSCAAKHGNDSVPATVLWEQYLPHAWVNITNALFLDASKGFVKCHNDTETGWFNAYHAASGGSSPLQWKPLIQGNFNVKDLTSISSEKDRRNQLTHFFLANRHDSLGRELYVLGEDGEMVQLTPPNTLTHTFAVHPSGRTVAVVISSASTASRLCLISVDRPQELEEVPSAWEFQLPDGAIVPQLIRLTNQAGAPMSAQLFLPPASTFSDQLNGIATTPLMMYVYGGPSVQLVLANQLESASSIVPQLLARKGIAVAVVDNVMASQNSLLVHSIAKKNMGHFEAPDYVHAARHICATFPALDVHRVGVYGWSYGGYASLLCMAQASDFFKLGLAGAPVGDWRLYDTGYTERYLGLLHEADGTTPNPAYTTSTIAAFAKGFPEEFNRLFIAHGLLDENVHFAHTTSVIEALVAEGKPYQLLVYPGERHGLRQKKESRMHYDAMLVKTVLQYL